MAMYCNLLQEKNMKTTLLVTAALVMAAGSAMASDAHWGYSGENGPENWAKLNPEYETCAKGVNQSPINLTSFIEAELEPFSLSYTGLATEILNNGHAIQANYSAGSTMTINGHLFELKQFHFHSPSENQINGKNFPMESHFVHADSKGNLAVIAVMYEVGDKENKTMKKLWSQMPKEEGSKEALASQVRADDLMPADKDYYRFNGSLTTPPCSEGVVWLVLKNPVTISKEQLKQFTEVIGHPDNRPVQDTNARPVLQ
jgi:carbonic anhydrase